jgi:hypothetical protein
MYHLIAFPRQNEIPAISASAQTGAPDAKRLDMRLAAKYPFSWSSPEIVDT